VAEMLNAFDKFGVHTHAHTYWVCVLCVNVHLCMYVVT